MRHSLRSTLALAALAALVACRPDFGERESRVDRTQVIAVVVEPPEARPGEPVTTSVVVASPDGPVPAVAAWAFCATPKLLTENGAVSKACLVDGVQPVAGAPSAAVTVALPARGCFDFGPEVQSADLRPRDPDVTGGFFAPVRARVPTSDGSVLTGFGFARLTCNLANASAENVQTFVKRYVANRNPTIATLEARLEPGAPVSLDAVPRSAHLVLRAAWRPEDAETYAYYDPTSATVVDRRESLRLTWLATAGDFAEDRTGRTETEPEAFTENGWTAPAEAGPVHVWTVLRDSRGGTTTRHEVMTVR